MSNTEEEQRVKFASEFISEMVKAGLSQDEVVATLSTYADMLDHLKEAGYSYDKVAAAFDSQDAEVINEITDKLALFGLDGAAQGLANMGSAGIKTLGNMGNTGIKALGDLGNTGVKTLAIGTALAGLGIPAAAYLGGKGLGAAAGHLTERDSDYIEEVKHDELLAMLRDNAATLRRRKATRDLQEGY